MSTHGFILDISGHVNQWWRKRQTKNRYMQQLTRCRDVNGKNKIKSKAQKILGLSTQVYSARVSLIPFNLVHFSGMMTYQDRTYHTSGEALNASYDAPLKKLTSVSFSVWKKSSSIARKHVAGIPMAQEAKVVLSSPRMYSSWSRLIIKLLVFILR